MLRQINTPDPERLTTEEAAAWLCLHLPEFRALLEDGTIPVTEEYSRVSRYWRWDEVYAISVLLPALLAKRGKGKTEKKVGPVEG